MKIEIKERGDSFFSVDYHEHDNSVNLNIFGLIPEGDKWKQVIYDEMDRLLFQYHPKIITVSLLEKWLGSDQEPEGGYKLRGTDLINFGSFITSEFLQYLEGLGYNYIGGSQGYYAVFER